MPRRTARHAVAVSVAAVAALLLSACSGSGYQYVKNSNDGSGTYFKVPDGWRIYDENALIKSRGLSPSQSKAAAANSWTVAFDASPNPSLKHFEQAVTQQPFGFAEVRTLGQQERDAFSLMAMRNEYVPVDDLASSGADVLPLRSDEFTRDGGFHGLRVTFEIALPNSKQSVTIDQVAIVDAGTKELHLLAISCRSSCYEKKKDSINKVVDSWTVKER